MNCIEELQRKEAWANCQRCHSTRHVSNIVRVLWIKRDNQVRTLQLCPRCYDLILGPNYDKVSEALGLEVC